jgi:hypothetical protein
MVVIGSALRPRLTKDAVDVSGVPMMTSCIGQVICMRTQST